MVTLLYYTIGKQDIKFWTLTWITSTGHFTKGILSIFCTKTK